MSRDSEVQVTCMRCAMSGEVSACMIEMLRAVARFVEMCLRKMNPPVLGGSASDQPGVAGRDVMYFHLVCCCRVGRWPHCAGAGAHARAGGPDPARVHQIWVVLPHQEHVRPGLPMQAPCLQPLHGVLNAMSQSHELPFSHPYMAKVTSSLRAACCLHRLLQAIGVPQNSK